MSGTGGGFSTRSIHAGSPDVSVGAPVVTPIYQTTTFHSDTDGQSEVLYTRYGNNPNHLLLEKRLRALEGAEECMLFASGMGAMTSAVLSCVATGDHVVATESIYGGTRLLLERELSRLGMETTFVDFQREAWRDSVRPTTRLFVLEIPSNPLVRITDPAPVVEVARATGAASLVDATFATPVAFRGVEHGIDLVVHSATKYLSGHTDVTAGVVCGGAERMKSVRDRAKIFGAALDPHAAWLLERGLKTLAVRMQRHAENGLKVATWCESRPGVASVSYPGLPSHPDHAVAKRLLDGFGGMMALELEGGGEAAARFIRALRLARAAPSLGGVETLVSEPRYTSHVAMAPEERAALGIRDGFVRFSLGIEDADDIIADIDQALGAV